MWKSSPARNSVSTCRNSVEYSRGVIWVQRNIWRRTLMLSSQWKKWCEQQKVVVDCAVMKEYAGGFIAVLRWSGMNHGGGRWKVQYFHSEVVNAVEEISSLCCWTDPRGEKRQFRLTAVMASGDFISSNFHALSRIVKTVVFPQNCNWNTGQ